MGSDPWLSIVTIVRNDAVGLAATLRSVSEQRTPGVEHLVIDGASTDETVQVLHRARERGESRVVSEPDTGIYNAMNKGLALSQGAYVQYLNAGDVFCSSQELSWVAQRLSEGPCEWLRTQVRFVDEAGHQTRPLGATRIDRHFWWGWQTTLHQGAFMTRDLLAGLGGFDESFRVIGDYDLMRRAVEAGVTPRCIDRVTVDVDASGVSTQMWRHGFREMHRSRSAGHAAAVRWVSAAEVSSHIGIVAGKRALRSVAERVLGEQAVKRLRSQA